MAQAGVVPKYQNRPSGGIPQPYNVLMPIIDWKTQNESFLVVHEQLKLLGIKNNAFHLILLNPLLQGVDPHSDNLTNDQVMMIIQECKLNVFYFLREVVLVEEQGGGLVHFRMDRGTLAACYHFYNNINFYLMKPRQTGKTVGICAMLAWAFKFSGPNAEFMFSCYKEELSKKNLRCMKNILSHLPSYMSKMGTTIINNVGKTERKTDNIKTYREPAQNNSAMVAPCASSEDSAETVGRGFTQCYQFFDEAEFTKFIDIIVKVSGMSFNTASANAEKNGSGYCRIFATTPGDLGNKACISAMKIVDDAVMWEERYYDDLEIDEYKDLISKKSSFQVVYIEYDYKQLGYDEKWFIRACKNVGYDVNKIKREILLQRFSGNSESPFTPDELEELNQNKWTPIDKITINRIYDIYFYMKPKKKRLYFIGIDPAEGTGGDNYSVTVLDPYELRVAAEFKSQFMTIDGCVDLVTYLVKNYFNNALLIIERNRNGGAVVERFKSSELRNMIYSTPEANSDNALVRDKYDPNGFIKEEFMRNKFFGTNTTTSSRQVMMNILLDIVHFSKEMVNSRHVVEDILNLVIKNNKIQAASGKHDDCVMSWLLTLYVLYYGKELERWGYYPNRPPQDIEEDDEFIKLQKLYKNPEIRRQFPSMYNYYQAEMEKRKLIEVREKTLEKQNADAMESTNGKIGGINNYNAEVRSESGVIDTKNQFTQNTIDEGDQWKKSVVAQFLSLNKL